MIATRRRELHAHLRRVALSSMVMWHRLARRPNLQSVSSTRKVNGFSPRCKSFLPPNRGAFMARAPSITSHIHVIRPVAPFGRHPVDILRRVFHVAGFAMDAVLRVDLEAELVPLLHHLIDHRRAITPVSYTHLTLPTIYSV